MSRSITPRSLIVGVFRLLGITAQGEEPTSAELLEAFDRLNELIDAWSTQRLTMRVTGRTAYPLAAGQATYTIGPTGTTPTPDWIGERPTRVEAVAYLLTTSTEPTEIAMSELTEPAWQAIAQKSLSNTQPTLWTYETTMAAGTLTVWPVPSVSGTVVLYTPEALAQFTALTTEVVMPPGYVRALRYNLARELAPEYGLGVSPEIATSAAEALSDLKRLNTPMTDLGMDAGLLPRGTGGYNILTDM